MLPPSRSHGISRRELLKGMAAAGIGTVTGAAAHGYLYERHHIEITRETVGVSGLPTPLAGLRIGLLTDLHRSQTVPGAMLDRAVTLIMSEAPDIIVLGGDYVTWGDKRYVVPAAEALAPISAPHGVFAVLGNHDNDRDMPPALSSNGFVVLRDARTRLTIRGETLELAGLRYWTRRVTDLAHVLRGASPNIILVAHTPMRLIEAAALGVPLVLSGHTHGGQIKIRDDEKRLIRRRKLSSGLHQRKNSQIYITRGIGTVVLPVRYQCPPEISFLELRCTE